jgi:hypothetical protein
MEEIERFIEDGFVTIRGAVPRRQVDACWAEVSAAIEAAGTDVSRPGTWTDPVIRIGCPESPAFAAAGTQPVLWEAYDQLLGAGTWWKRPGVGGTVPVRFPVPGDPGDAGWHVDGSYEIDGVYALNLRSRGRGLLCLFLLTDVGPDDAPTELKVGSHLDLPAVLEPFGDDGADFVTVARAIPPSTLVRRSAFATGTAGDVFVCHPFLVHRATWPHRGTRPRAIAQPGVATRRPFEFGPGPHAPVEAAILRGLAGSRAPAA